MDQPTFIHRLKYAVSWWSIFLNPSFPIRRGLFVAFEEIFPSLQGKILDFGCGERPYEFLLNVKSIGLDVEISGREEVRKLPDIVYDGKTIPAKDGEFDAVICLEVLEHLPEPSESLREIYRVLKPGGKFVCSVPFFMPEHEAPYDFQRYTYFGLEKLLKLVGFQLTEIKRVGTFWKTIFQASVLYFYYILRDHFKILLPAYLLFVAFPLHIFGYIFSFLLPKNSSLYLNLVAVAQKEK
ncbi:class I SAM-dependent methyltransferase [Leptospira perolatii]|uniref:class I SAM-dependent methyltransferase n=1 Tax=Leptospira perolatii TaxID=2023191 RepID=UPI0013FDEFBD|nr:class I SAM-dependent methyltransferase [Leptospira perolatii]